MAEAKKTGLLAQHQIDTSSVHLPNGWSDTTFIPYDFGYFAFVYNKEKVTNPPKSLKELVEQRDDLKVIYQDPRTSTPGQGLLLWMKSVYGDDAAQAWKQLSKKTVTVTKGWSEAYSMFLEGSRISFYLIQHRRLTILLLKKINDLLPLISQKAITLKLKLRQKLNLQNTINLPTSF